MPPFTCLPPYRVLFRVLSAYPALLMAISCFRLSAQVPQTFSCSDAKQAIHLSAGSLYSDRAASDNQPAFGFDRGTVPTRFNGNSCSAAKPFFFSVALHDGNYRITLQLGGPEESVNTVRAESRRLMAYQERVAAGDSRSVVFNVSVLRLRRTPHGSQYVSNRAKLGRSTGIPSSRSNSTAQIRAFDPSKFAHWLKSPLYIWQVTPLW